MSKMLLHTCCAPCSIAIVDELKSKYDLTVFFYNPNIHPEEEYLKRKKEVVKVCEEWNVPMVDMDSTPPSLPLAGEENVKLDYGQNKWHDEIRGLENEPEGGARCSKCFSIRLKRSAQYASENGFDIYSTSLTSGRNKKADIICPLGESFGKKYGVEFYCEDWKKGGRPTSAKATVGKQESRQEKATRLINERGIYRQDYCGCIYSS